MMLGAALTEFLAVVGASTGWKIAHVVFGLACVVIGIVAFIHPGNTFAALAAVMSFYFILKGMFDVILGIVVPGLRWLRIGVGLAEMLLGFWAAAYFGRSVILLVAWVGAVALTRGITEIVFAFTVRGYREEAA
jgi:uncharacterized membrane protein HdeD (DUF308 family)